MIGTDAFQETPIVEVCRGITKHHYLVTDVNDVARVMREAFHIATTGRPGPVLVDLPKDVQLAPIEPDYDVPMNLPGYHVEDRKAKPEQIRQVAAAIKRSKRPIIYAGGGVISGEASQELRELVRKTKIPVAMTVMGLGAFPANDRNSLDMLGMHGSVYANYAVNEADLLLAFGVRFDDRVTGKLAEFAKHGKIVHIDIDPSEINKNKAAHIPIVSDIKFALAELNKIVEAPDDLSEWHQQIAAWKKSDPLKYDQKFDGILQQHAIDELSKLTRGEDTIITVGVGQHQMWAAQFYKFMHPRTFLSSSGLGTMGFGLPAAMGAKAAHPDKLVVDIDGDGSFLMNIQELATCLLRKAAGQGAAVEQPAPGHGGAVGRPLLQRQPGPHLPGPDRPSRSDRRRQRPGPVGALSRFRQHRQGLRLRRCQCEEEERTGRRIERNDRLPRPLRARRRSALSRARAADDPRRHDGEGSDQGVSHERKSLRVAATSRGGKNRNHRPTMG